VEILRHVIQRLKLVAKLKQQIDTKSGGYQDLAKAAKLLADIDNIGSEADLAGLDVVEADSEFLHSTWRDVQGQAEARMLLLRFTLCSLSIITNPHYVRCTTASVMQTVY